jgi:FtsZ-binding cell division protein ZapB
MISLDQIRLLEGKITRAIELIKVLKEENATLRNGLDSAQNRMKELETLVEGFKSDQKEIESVIVRTLKHLDDLEENAVAGPAPRKAEAPREAASSGRAPQSGRAASAGKTQKAASNDSAETGLVRDVPAAGLEVSKGELDIF